MARRLSPIRRWSFASLALLVLLLHWILVDRLQAEFQRWSALEEMPPRMQAAFVRELKMAAPVGGRAVARPPRQELTPPLSVPALPASAVQPEPVPVMESLPPQVAMAPELTGTVPAPAASAAESDEPGPEWPASTRLSYSLYGFYNGDVHGDAQVEWIRQGRRYQVHLDVGVGPRLTPFITRRMSSEGELGPRGISPRRYDEDTKIIFRERRRTTLTFRPGQVQLAGGRTEPTPLEVQDSSSQFVQLTWLFLTGREPARVGHVVTIPLALPRRQYGDWRYEVTGEEIIDTPMGPIATWHLRPTRPISGGDLSAEIWLAPTLQWLPVRLRIRQDEQTFVDLLLKSPPLQAAPDPIVPSIKKESRP
ncbi:DUF3108 domain-containing protein [Pelomonas sp. SE-A7]|uniref:DUF3108 domain-containing protein n=1 Tax=Pelomonas sp. SE-A7 TaxID=3054953 RepID=UPI00259CBE54|nr:DUF3108 domain-containing protein [Pelomonas sp. SE-A7]MDM4767568.1 DUF3108 domain-containing protein [Pelomonas sp. SE-A7]